MEGKDRICSIKGVGEKTEKLFAKLGIFTVEELLEHYPRNYETYGEIIPAARLQPGETAVVEVSLVAALAVKKARGLTILSGRARDTSGDVILTWFNMPFLKNTIKPGTRYLFRGLVSRRNGNFVLEQPFVAAGLSPDPGSYKPYGGKGGGAGFKRDKARGIPSFGNTPGIWAGRPEGGSSGNAFPEKQKQHGGGQEKDCF